MTTTALEVTPASDVDKPRGIPYERIVEWAAGPIAIIAGSVAVWLDNHFSLLGKAGLGHDQTAKAIIDGLTFAVGAGLTYLGHSKWLSNLAQWWTNAQTVTANQEGGSTVAQEEEQTTPEDTPAEQAPFEDEPGYDEPGPGVEPDQDLDKSNEQSE